MIRKFWAYLQRLWEGLLVLFMVSAVLVVFLVMGVLAMVLEAAPILLAVLVGVWVYRGS